MGNAGTPWKVACLFYFVLCWFPWVSVRSLLTHMLFLKRIMQCRSGHLDKMNHKNNQFSWKCFNYFAKCWPSPQTVWQCGLFIHWCYFYGWFAIHYLRKDVWGQLFYMTLSHIKDVKRQKRSNPLFVSLKNEEEIGCSRWISQHNLMKTLLNVKSSNLLF